MIKPFSLRKIILREVLRQKEIEGNRFWSDRVFHAHEAGKCPREIYFRRSKKPERTFESRSEEARIALLLGDGRPHQESVSKPLRSSPELELTNVEHMRTLPIDDFFIVGSDDGIVHFKEKRYVIEVKGLSTWTCKKFKEETIEELKQAYPTAIAQARMYSRIWYTNGAFILVKDKDNAKLYEFFLPRNEKAEDRIIEKFRIIRKALIEGRPPGCSFEKGEWQQKYCDYPSECGQ